MVLIDCLPLHQLSFRISLHAQGHFRIYSFSHLVNHLIKMYLNAINYLPLLGFAHIVQLDVFECSICGHCLGFVFGFRLKID